jgi:hypothetical protein
LCLVFNKDTLISSLIPQLETEGTHPTGRPVTYENRRLSGELFFDIGKVLSAGGVDAVVEEIAAQHLIALFFTKQTDWASEHEFRFVVATDSPEPLHVDTSDALQAVIMGYECAPGFVPALAELCRKQDVKVRALHWFNVEPHLTGIAIDPQ